MHFSMSYLLMSRLPVTVNGFSPGGQATKPKTTWVKEGYFCRPRLFKTSNLARLRIARKNCEHWKTIQQSSHPHWKPTGIFFFSWPIRVRNCQIFETKKRHFGHVHHGHLIHDERVIAALLSPGFEQKVRRKRNWYWNEHCCGAEGGEACSNSSVRPQCCAAAENKLWSRCVYSVHGLLQGQWPCVQICQAFVKHNGAGLSLCKML